MAEAGHLRETPQVDGAGAEEPALGRLGSLQGLGDFDRAAVCVKSREVPRFTRWVVSTFSPFFPNICLGLKIILQQQQLVATYGSIGMSPVYPQLSSSATRPSEGQLGEACGLRGEGGSLLLGRPGWRSPGPLVGGAMGHRSAAETSTVVGWVEKPEVLVGTEMLDSNLIKSHDISNVIS